MASGPNHPGARRPRPAEPDSAEARVCKKLANEPPITKRENPDKERKRSTKKPSNRNAVWKSGGILSAGASKMPCNRAPLTTYPAAASHSICRRDPFVPEDQQMAFRLLHNNDLVPAWIGDRKEVLQTIDALRADIRRVALQLRTEWDAHQATETSKNRNAKNRQVWERYVSRWEADIAQLNRRILNLNLKQPAAHLEVFKVLLDEELTKIGATRTHFLPG